MENEEASNLLAPKNELFEKGYLKNLVSHYMNNELQTKNDCLTKSLSELNTQFKEKCLKIDTLENDIKNSNEWKKSSLLELQKCSFALEKLTSLYNDVTKFVQLLIEKKAKLTKRIKDIDSVIKEDFDHISSQLIHLKEIEAENVKNLENNAELKQKTENLDLEIKNLQKEISELQEKNEDNLRMLQTNEKILTNLKIEKDQINSKNKNLDETVQGLTRELKIVKENYNTQLNEIEKLKEQLNDSNSKLTLFETQNHVTKHQNQISNKVAKKNECQIESNKSDNGNISDNSSDLSFSIDKKTEDQDDISLHERMADLAAKGQWAKLKRPNKSPIYSKERKVARVSKFD